MATVIAESKAAQKEDQYRDDDGDFGEQRCILSEFEHAVVLREEFELWQKTHIEGDDKSEYTDISWKFSLLKNTGK